MKTIRQIAGLLLLSDGVLHCIDYVMTSDNPGSMGLIVFGIIYILTGLLLFSRKMYPVYLGIVVPLIGMTLSLIKFGVPELFSLSALFKLLGLLSMGCCGYILVSRRKP